jgi:hypothetical protein
MLFADDAADLLPQVNTNSSSRGKAVMEALSDDPFLPGIQPLSAVRTEQFNRACTASHGNRRAGYKLLRPNADTRKR